MLLFSASNRCVRYVPAGKETAGVRQHGGGRCRIYGKADGRRSPFSVCALRACVYDLGTCSRPADTSSRIHYSAFLFFSLWALMTDSCMYFVSSKHACFAVHHYLRELVLSVGYVSSSRTYACGEKKSGTLDSTVV